MSTVGMALIACVSSISGNHRKDEPCIGMRRRSLGHEVYDEIHYISLHTIFSKYTCSGGVYWKQTVPLQDIKCLANGGHPFTNSL